MKYNLHNVIEGYNSFHFLSLSVIQKNVPKSFGVDHATSYQP